MRQERFEGRVLRGLWSRMVARAGVRENGHLAVNFDPPLLLCELQHGFTPFRVAIAYCCFSVDTCSRRKYLDPFQPFTIPLSC